MHRKPTYTLAAVALTTAFASILACDPSPSAEQADRKAVANQQAQYAKGQPVPAFDWSLERELVIQLYNARNRKVATHSVWRSDTGVIEGDCPSIGYGIPYDTSLTNPLAPSVHGGASAPAAVALGQAEPNGVFASTNTSATFVTCAGPGGTIAPVYVESKVTVYPGPVSIDHDTNRVTPVGPSAVSISLD